MGEPITLSQVEYDVLWGKLALGPFRPLLAVTPPGRTDEEIAERTDNAWRSLAAKGLGRPNEVNPRVERQLRRLARPEWELDVRMFLSETGPRTTALVAKARKATTIAVLHEDELTLHETKNNPISDDAVNVLAPHPAGTGGSITLPKSTMDSAAAKADSDPDRLARALSAAGLGKTESRKLTEVLSKIIRIAHFGAAHTPPEGRRRRAPHMVSVYDTPQARYLFTRKKDWITLLPGTPAAIARQLDEQLTSLTR